MSPEESSVSSLPPLFPKLLVPQEVRGGLLSAIHTITSCLSNALLGEAAGRHSEAPVYAHGLCSPAAADLFADPVFQRPPPPPSPFPRVCAICAALNSPMPSFPPTRLKSESECPLPARPSALPHSGEGRDPSRSHTPTNLPPPPVRAQHRAMLRQACRDLPGSPVAKAVLPVRGPGPMASQDPTGRQEDGENESESVSHSLILCNPMSCSPPGSSFHGTPLSRGSSRPRDQTQVSRTVVDSLPSEPPGKPKSVRATTETQRGQINK